MAWIPQDGDMLTWLQHRCNFMLWISHSTTSPILFCWIQIRWLRTSKKTIVIVMKPVLDYLLCGMGNLLEVVIRGLVNFHHESAHMLLWSSFLLMGLSDTSLISISCSEISKQIFERELPVMTIILVLWYRKLSDQTTLTLLLLNSVMMNEQLLFVHDMSKHCETE